MVPMAHPDITRIEAARLYYEAKRDGSYGAVSEVETVTGFPRQTLRRWLIQFATEIKNPPAHNSAGVRFRLTETAMRIPKNEIHRD